ncbi:bifunctional DNA primase/polymerase [Sphingobacterium sp. lm-10]|uniref:bifunctional DNA primase/polymerase n=1 Tax=Sphingobacterium sp. lm-10 TaxID=2944904 RepID=UPI002020A2BC|nr:bifunctional DNA primase/polymerase [Sphingobacterium sp. lm-10]MCL7987758.1 bifunctional DNA primase/polymerase [Sphingobacterium sp. lm-10]
MAVELANIWAEILPLVKDGVSLIAVREKEEKGRPAKTPYGFWTEYQKRRADESELWHILESHDTNAIAAVCGVISGNLECIDIDSKYYPGIDAQLLADINKFYPHLYTRLRIHRTPSGGYHIVYRISDRAPEGNQKLAGRPTTQAEQQAQRDRGAKRPSKTVNFLETRGEGGYFLYPPSMGYAVVQDMPIPIVTWEERCSLINLCRTYDEVVRIAPMPKPTQSQESYYTTNPFEDYNYRCDPLELMQSQGWSFLRENQRFIWFTRPDKTDGVSASWNKEKRVFYVFTTSTDLEATRGYNPATLLAEFTFDGDKKKAFRWLIDQGFGKVKRAVEQSIIKKAAINGTAAIPANFSSEAQEEFIQLQDQYSKQHPHGIFWEYDDKGKFVISRQAFLYVAKELGFRLYKSGAVQINGSFVMRITLIEFFKLMKEYIQEEEANVYDDICDAYEKFIQASGKFILDSRLEQFEDADCVQDSSDVCYKFYNNVAVRITASSITPIEYDKIDGFIWADKMLSRNYQKDATASDLYERYLKNATGIDDSGKVKDYVRNIIGFLCHDYNSPISLYAIILTEMVNDPRKGGGSGKNIFVNLLKNFIGVSTASGAMIKWDDKFYAVWNDASRIYFIPDIPRKINWEFIKSTIEDPYINKKYKGEYSVNIQDSPKVVFNTNYSYEDSDGGLHRRFRPIEFTDYYTVNGGVDVVHGKLFPDGFDSAEWKGFDDFVLGSIKYHLSQGCKIERIDLSDNGWEKKFTIQYGEKTLEFISDNISTWLASEYVEVSNFQKSYDDYVATELKEKYKLSQRTLNSAVREFCERHEITFDQSVVKKITHTTKRVHVFKGEFKCVIETSGEEYPF